MKPILEVRDLWKEYRIGVQKEKYLSLRDNLFNFIKPGTKKETFWALKNLNFHVNPGDSLAIIGKNGAGKSTLLKILSKITPPTKGEIIMRGRLASLLEVGTGFHPELSGRENIYLNGSILGLGKKEINKQFDEIVDFSGVEAFLETPLKHYSSGMQLRLAFAVAAHLEPEILVIDEVLAVGDSVFQQKCIDKMTEVSRSGRTILFVSHNMQAVRNLCTKGILLTSGAASPISPIDEIITQYTYAERALSSLIDLSICTRDKRSALKLKFVSAQINGPVIPWGETIHITLSLQGEHSINDIEIAMNIKDLDNNTIYHISNQWINKPLHYNPEVNTSYTIQVSNNLKPGRYKINLFLQANDSIQDWINDAFLIEISSGNPYSFSNTEIIQGKVFPDFKISVENGGR